MTIGDVISSVGDKGVARQAVEKTWIVKQDIVEYVIDLCKRIRNILKSVTTQFHTVLNPLVQLLIFFSQKLVMISECTV